MWIIDWTIKLFFPDKEKFKEFKWLVEFIFALIFSIITVVLFLPFYFLIGKWGRKKIRKKLNAVGFYDILFGETNKYGKRIEEENKQEGVAPIKKRHFIIKNPITGEPAYYD